MVHGVSPGPLLIRQQPDLFWGFIASMYVGNVVLLILNLPLVGLFVNILRVPYSILYPCILAFCVLGVYAVNGSVVDVWIMLLMGALGYLLRKAMSDGQYAIFVTRPISTTLLVVGLILIALALKPLVTRSLDWRGRMALAEKGEEHS
jgi:putative tricarboxylic transport membrane protein